MGKIIVLGGEGMLGHKMVQTLRQKFPDVACTIRGSLDDGFYRRTGLFGKANSIPSIDAMNLHALESMLTEHKPEFIVNCIGVIKQRDEARNALVSVTLNSLLPHTLADVSARWGGRVIHFSTDCVFSGMKGHYTEDDPSDAEDLYGKSKYLGEVAAENALTLRTSIIGRELSHFKSLLEWFLAQEGKPARGFRRVLYSGVTTNHISKVVGNIIAECPSLSGLYQVTGDTISKHDLLYVLRDAFQLDVEIVADDEQVSDRSMRGDKFRAATGMVCPEWPEMAAELASDLTPYGDWRVK